MCRILHCDSVRIFDKRRRRIKFVFQRAHYVSYEQVRLFSFNVHMLIARVQCVFISYLHTQLSHLFRQATTTNIVREEEEEEVEKKK